MRISDWSSDVCSSDLGRRIGLPAAIITGPVILSTLVHALGWTDAVPPPWLISVAQLVIGVGLALRFGGMTRRLLTQGIGFGAASVALMLSIGEIGRASCRERGGQYV